MVQHIFARERPHLLHTYGPFAGDFDLHDVYVCAEATLLEVYARCDHYSLLSAPGRRVNERLLSRFQAVLLTIGQTLTKGQV